MEPRIGSKLKILYIIDILKKYSDEEHPINATEICEKLWSYGIAAERKAIYSDIENLIFYGFDIIKTRSPRAGFFMGTRELELPELYLLIDAVQAANFITPKKTRELVKKLENMMSGEQAKAREKSVFFEYKNKCKNEEIFIIIDGLRTAIEQNKKVLLKYQHRKIDDGRQLTFMQREFVISPYALIWMGDHYYLVCNNEKYNNLMHMRLDRMRGVTILDEPRRHHSEVSPYKDRFDIADYAGKSFNMFGGEVTDIEFTCSYEILDQVIDRFSEDIYLAGASDETFTFRTKGMVSEGLVGWILQFGGDIEVKSPKKLRDMITEKVEVLQKTYKKD